MILPEAVSKTIEMHINKQEKMQKDALSSSSGNQSAAVSAGSSVKHKSPKSSKNAQHKRNSAGS